MKPFPNCLYLISIPISDFNYKAYPFIHLHKSKPIIKFQSQSNHKAKIDYNFKPTNPHCFLLSLLPTHGCQRPKSTLHLFTANKCLPLVRAQTHFSIHMLPLPLFPCADANTPNSQPLTTILTINLLPINLT